MQRAQSCEIAEAACQIAGIEIVEAGVTGTPGIDADEPSWNTCRRHASTSFSAKDGFSGELAVRSSIGGEIPA